MREALTAAGLTLHAGVEDGLPGAGHILLVEAAGEETYDLVRDTVADLGLGLVRMEQRRHHIAEVFRPRRRSRSPNAPPHGQPPRPAPSRREAAAMATDSAQTQIHNIGYRNYDGPRLGRAYARRSLFSQSLRGAYGLGRCAKSKVLPMLLFAVMCVPAAIMVAVAVATKANDLPVDYTRYAIFLQAVIGAVRRRPGAADRLPRPALQDHAAVLLAADRARRLRPGQVRGDGLGPVPPDRRTPADPLRRRAAGQARLRGPDQGFAQGLVSVALLSLLFAGIGLVIAALTPRRGFGVAAVIAVLAISYGAVSAVQAIAFSQGSAERSAGSGCSRPSR